MKHFTALVIAACLLMLAGCNTVKGMGQDLKKVGEKIEGAVQK